MIRVRETRFLLALLLAALGAWLMYAGVRFFAFQFGQLTISDRAARANFAEGYASAPGTASVARSMELLARGASSGGDGPGYVLELAPAVGIQWLQLAESRARAGDNEAAVKALAMASVTAPNESWQARRRALLGIRLWPLLSADAQRAVVTDLSNNFKWLSTAQETELLVSSVMMDDKGYGEIRALLQRDPRNSVILDKYFAMPRVQDDGAEQPK